MAKSSTGDRSADFSYSVVIAARDSEATIASAVESALDQSVLPSEIIVVDDGSSDSTADVVRSIGSPLIVVERQENAGPGQARNRGIAIARGEWVAFLDADDRWSSDHAQSLGELSARFPDARLLAAAFCEVAEGSRRIAGPGKAGKWSAADFLDGPALSPIHTSGVAIQRSFALDLGGFPREFPGEDVDLWLRSALAGPIAVTGRATSCYSRRSGSIMADQGGVVAKLPRQPLLKSLDDAIGDPAHAGIRSSILRYRENAYRSFLQMAVAQSDPVASRTLVRMMRGRQIPVPVLLAGLSAAPRPALLAANAVRRRLLARTSNHGK